MGSMHRVSDSFSCGLIEGKEEAVAASWRRLLDDLEAETDRIRNSSCDIIPSISFDDLKNPQELNTFTSILKQRGVGIVRGVVADNVVRKWTEETRQYVGQNTTNDLAKACQEHEVFWSPAQIKARAHPNILDTQRLLMNIWHTSEKDPLTPNFPIVYADKLHTTYSRTTNGSTKSLALLDGSIERWDIDGRETYREVWDGRWEDHDPWTSRERLQATSSSESPCSTFQLFQGRFCLEGKTALPLRICPLLRLSNAYVLLRPFFEPKLSTDHPEYLSADNWRLRSGHSLNLQHVAQREVSDALHPHLCLPQTLLPVSLEPGDYLVFHPDTIYAPQHSSSTTIALPTCPLTRANALYLLRQRKAFLLGQPPPDFQQSRANDSRWDGRLGVQEISDTGGGNALRAMGLAPWDEDDVEGVMEAEVVEDANNVLFPDRHDFEMDWT